jgi:vacuolar-type H+-ATPase subunit E/Vma4
MSLEVLKEDILLKAKLEKERILKNLDKEISKLEKEFDLEKNNYQDLLESKFEKEKAILERQIIGKSEKEAKTLILNSKNKYTESVLEDFKSQIDNLTKKEKEELLSSLIKKAEKLIDYDIVLCNKSYLSFVKSKMKKNSKIVESDIKGLIFKNKSETEILDLRFSEIIDSVFELNNNKIQEVLFK